MYQAHFGLKRALFENGVAQDAAVFLAPQHERIIANAKVALTTLDSAVVLTGTAGVGKTTLMASALRATSTKLALGWVTGAPSTAPSCSSCFSSSSASTLTASDASSACRCGGSSSTK